MKNNYLLCWTKRMFFLLTIMLGMNMSAQSFLVSFPSFGSAPVNNPRGIVVSNGTSMLQVQLDTTTGSATGGNITIQLPPGIEYIPGSVTVVNSIPAGGVFITATGGTPNAPTFHIAKADGSINNIDRIIFTIERKATCAARTATLSGTTFKDEVKGIAPTTVTTGLSPAYTVNYPALSLTQPATQTNVLLNTNYTRTFTVTNGGVGAATAVYFSIDYPTGVSQVSLMLDATALTPT